MELSAALPSGRPSAPARLGWFTVDPHLWWAHRGPGVQPLPFACPAAAKTASSFPRLLRVEPGAHGWRPQSLSAGPGELGAWGAGRKGALPCQCQSASTRFPVWTGGSGPQALSAPQAGFSGCLFRRAPQAVSAGRLRW